MRWVFREELGLFELIRGDFANKRGEGRFMGDAILDPGGFERLLGVVGAVLREVAATESVFELLVGECLSLRLEERFSIGKNWGLLPTDREPFELAVWLDGGLTRRFAGSAGIPLSEPVEFMT